MNITVYLGASSGNRPVYKENIEKLGAMIGGGGHTLVYGGSRTGLMGALADAVMAAGGRVIGVEAKLFFDRCLMKEGLSETYIEETIPSRRSRMIELGDAFLAYPGGTGTLEEVSEVMSMIRTGILDKPCMLLNLDGYYEHLKKQLDVMVSEGFLINEARDMISFPETVEEVFDILREAK